MRLVILEAESLGKDMDLSGFSRFGEVTVYEKTTEEERWQSFLYKRKK